MSLSRFYEIKKILQRGALNRKSVSFLKSYVYKKKTLQCMQFSFEFLYIVSEL
jgi:hypothetical protein